MKLTVESGSAAICATLILWQRNPRKLNSDLIMENIFIIYERLLVIRRRRIVTRLGGPRAFENRDLAGTLQGTKSCESHMHNRSLITEVDKWKFKKIYHPLLYFPRIKL